MKKTLVLFFLFSLFSTSKVFAEAGPPTCDPCYDYHHCLGEFHCAGDGIDSEQSIDLPGGPSGGEHISFFLGCEIRGRSAGSNCYPWMPSNEFLASCANCPVSGHCSNCEQGYYQVGTNTTVCYKRATSCNPGYKLVKNGTGANDKTCIKCDAGTYQSESNFTGNSCTNCPSGQTSEPGAASCSAAVTCSEHCTTCTSETNCTACATGYYVADGQCVERKTKCGPGYKLVKTGSASNDKTCIACDPGTEQTQSNYTGSTCTPCPNGATSRTPGSNCDMCMRVYPLSHYGMCVACDPEYCLRGLCEGEPNLVWDEVVHDCVPINCSEHCTTCTSEANCTACEAGYVLQGGACVHAQARCQAPYIISDDGCCCVKAEESGTAE